MTAAGDALAAVRAAGGFVRVVLPDRLRVTAPAPLPSDLMQRLRALKPELLISLTKGELRQTDTCGARDEGRAAIVKPEGGALREWSEALARLDTERPPGGVRVDGKTLLKQAKDAGLAVRLRGDQLVIRGPLRAAPMVQKLFANKATIVHVLAPAKLDSTGWRALYLERLRYWRCNRPDDEARRIAWGDVECRWHERYGDRAPHGLCAGCRQPLGHSKVLALSDGNVVHFDHLQCLLDFGRRWREAATAALQRTGLQPPASCPR